MSGRASTRFLYDGSYIRLKNLVFGYSFPKSFINKAHLSNLRVYVMGENLLTFTKYPGADPEFFRATDNAGSNIAPGLAGISMPQVRTISIGVSVGL
ncbi:MAG: TonB-dependent receptor [Bacteroidetes bacterium]|nr:TonB-dependent receptor [Bacteroidota bacterium]